MSAKHEKGRAVSNLGGLTPRKPRRAGRDARAPVRWRSSPLTTYSLNLDTNRHGKRSVGIVLYLDREIAGRRELDDKVVHSEFFVSFLK